MAASQTKLVSIIGPTASGKTALAISLAKLLEQRTGQPCEIINADAYQMYRLMDIGTAKASLEERAEVPHHLIDIIEPSDDMSVARFQTLARQTIDELQGRGVRPILVGGSGLYARAAIDDITFPGTDPDIRARIERRAEEIGYNALFDELAAKDPEAAAHMDARNVRRTVRALEVIELTGQPFSATLPHYRYVVPSVQIGIDMNRQLLDARIDLRTEIMRKLGFTREVEGLRRRLSVTASRALGYPDIIEFLDGQISEDEAYARVAQHTKRLARKQMGWFGRDPRVHWLYMGSHDDNNALGVHRGEVITDSEILCMRAIDIVLQADRGEFDEHDDTVADYTQRHLGSGQN